MTFYHGTTVQIRYGVPFFGSVKMLKNILIKMCEVLRSIEVTILSMDRENRMLRLGVGKHNGIWFIRLDLWWKGIRLSF